MMPTRANHSTEKKKKSRQKHRIHFWRLKQHVYFINLFSIDFALSAPTGEIMSIRAAMTRHLSDFERGKVAGARCLICVFHKLIDWDFHKHLGLPGLQ